jgi:hypothetical protein
MWFLVVMFVINGELKIYAGAAPGEEQCLKAVPEMQARAPEHAVVSCVHVRDPKREI